MKNLIGPFILITLFLSSCNTLSQFFNYGSPDVYDYRIFESSYIEPSPEPFHFPQVENVTLPTPNLWACEKKVAADCSPEQFLENSNTLALIVIRKDTIVYENYGNGHSRESISQVFSITKSFVATLVGIAIDEGHIIDVNQPVSDFIPEFKEGGLQKVQIQHLLNMTSGINFGDYQNIYKLVTLYYSRNQDAMLDGLKAKHKPGEHFMYSSMSTYVLGSCLEKATGVPIEEYLQEKIWDPLGMEYSARLAKDAKGGKTKFYGGLAARGLDLAKLGRLYMNNGMWNGKRIISEEWVMASRQRVEGPGSEKYAYHWWLDTFDAEFGDDRRNDFFAGGFRGQIIYVNPTDSMVVVRLGTSEKSVRWGHTISKLALMPLEPINTVKETFALTKADGNYRNRKLNKSINLKSNGKDVLIEGFVQDAIVTLRKAGRFSYTDDTGHIRLILNYKNQQVKSILLEGDDSSVFFEKVL